MGDWGEGFGVFGEEVSFLFLFEDWNGGEKGGQAIFFLVKLNVTSMGWEFIDLERNLKEGLLI